MVSRAWKPDSDVMMLEHCAAEGAHKGIKLETFCVIPEATQAPTGCDGAGDSCQVGEQPSSDVHDERQCFIKRTPNLFWWFFLIPLCFFPSKCIFFTPHILKIYNGGIAAIYEQRVLLI